MTSNRPYLLRAVYEWILDNDLTPQIVVNAELEDVAVPRQFVCDGQIVLNVAPTAVRGLELGNERISFSARFSGSPFNIDIPVRAVHAIFCRENGAGMTFPEETQHSQPGPPAPEDSPPGRPRLKVVK